MSTIHFTDLPHDILYEICSHISKNQYKNLSFTCKKLNEVVKKEIFWVPKNQGYLSFHAAFIDCLDNGNIKTYELVYQAYLLANISISVICGHLKKRAELFLYVVKKNNAAMLDRLIRDNVITLSSIYMAIADFPKNFNPTFVDVLIKHFAPIHIVLPEVKSIFQHLINIACQDHNNAVIDKIIEYNKQNNDIFPGLFEEFFLYILAGTIADTETDYLEQLFPLHEVAMQELFQLLVLGNRAKVKCYERFLGGIHRKNHMGMKKQSLIFDFGYHILDLILKWQEKHNRILISKDQIIAVAEGTNFALLKRLLSNKKIQETYFSDKNNIQWLIDVVVNSENHAAFDLLHKLNIL